MRYKAPKNRSDMGSRASARWGSGAYRHPNSSNAGNKNGSDKLSWRKDDVAGQKSAQNNIKGTEKIFPREPNLLLPENVTKKVQADNFNKAAEAAGS